MLRDEPAHLVRHIFVLEDADLSFTEGNLGNQDDILFCAEDFAKNYRVGIERQGHRILDCAIRAAVSRGKIRH